MKYGCLIPIVIPLAGAGAWFWSLHGMTWIGALAVLAAVAIFVVVAISADMLTEHQANVKEAVRMNGRMAYYGEEQRLLDEAYNREQAGVSQPVRVLGHGKQRS